MAGVRQTQANSLRQVCDVRPSAAYEVLHTFGFKGERLAFLHGEQRVRAVAAGLRVLSLFRVFFGFALGTCLGDAQDPHQVLGPRDGKVTGAHDSKNA